MYEKNITFRNNVECSDKVQKLIEKNESEKEGTLISIMDVFYSKKYDGCFYEIQETNTPTEPNTVIIQNSYFMKYGVDQPITSKNGYYQENCLSLEDKNEMKNCLESQKTFFEIMDEYRGHTKY